MGQRYQSVKVQCADCESRFALFLLLAEGKRPTVEPSSNVRRQNGKFVHLCGGPLRILLER